MCRRGSPGKGQRTPGHVPSRGRQLPPPPRKRPRAATGRSSRPAGNGPGAGSRVGRSSAGRRVALPVPARRGGRTRVSASRPRAPPGLASAAAPEAGGPGLCAAERRGRRAERTAASPESVGHSGRPRRGSARSCPRPPGAGRVRALPPALRTGRRGVAPESATRGARTALIRAAPRQADARRSMVGSERDEPPVLHRPQR